MEQKKKHHELAWHLNRQSVFEWNFRFVPVYLISPLNMTRSKIFSLPFLTLLSMLTGRLTYLRDRDTCASRLDIPLTRIFPSIFFFSFVSLQIYRRHNTTALSVRFLWIVRLWTKWLEGIEDSIELTLPPSIFKKLPSLSGKAWLATAQFGNQLSIVELPYVQLTYNHEPTRRCRATYKNRLFGINF